MMMMMMMMMMTLRMMMIIPLLLLLPLLLLIILLLCNIFLLQQVNVSVEYASTSVCPDLPTSFCHHCQRWIIAIGSVRPQYNRSRTGTMLAASPPQIQDGRLSLAVVYHVPGACMSAGAG